VILLVITTILSFTVDHNSNAYKYILFFGDPVIVMLISLIGATYTLGLRTGKPMKAIMKTYADSVADIAIILLIISGAGALKQVFYDSGVSSQIGQMLMGLDIHPLLLGWLIAAVIRVCLGSATIAGLTTAGIIAPLITQSHVNPNLMVLSIGAGSLLFSHVNDSGFWLFKEYFNLSVKDTIRSWSLMETIVGVMGLIGVMILNAFIS
jgi:Gnt-I system high-affinity gluconate transporter